MKLHIFLSRIAFLCNVLFLYCLLVRRTGLLTIKNETINSYIIILGYFPIGPFLNVIVNVTTLYFLFSQKLNSRHAALFTFNLLILLFQGWYIFR